MKLEEKFKKDFLNELNSPDQSKTIMDKIGVKNNNAQVVKSKSFWQKILDHKKIWIAALCSILIIALGVGGTFGYITFINIPIYEGMEVRNDGGALAGVKLAADEQKDIEDAINQEITPVIPEGIAYYAKKGEKIQITVKISNPKSYEILSFTLNGRLYQTFEFKEGSNSEQIIVDFVCQDTSGLQIVTIDAIKYVQGTSIRDVRFKGDRELTLGITYEEVPEVLNLSEIIGTTEFGLSFVTTDVNNLMDKENGLMMYVFDGESIINISHLRIGMNVFPFSNLRMGKTYEYAVVGVYDQLDGRGKCANILAKNKFTTKEGLEYSDITSSYDSINVSFDKVHKEDITISNVYLKSGETQIDALKNPDGTYSFGDLLSNKTYTLFTTYKYVIVENGQPIELENTIQKEVSTLERPIPTIEFKDIVVGKENVSFNFDIVDTVMTQGKILNIKVYLNDELVKEVAGDSLEILDLLSNNDYVLEVTYEYDLKDGNPKATITNSVKIHTLEKTAPTVSFNNGVFFGNMLTVFFNQSDTEVILHIDRFELYNSKGELVATKEKADHFDSVKNEGDLVFTGITESGDYLVVAVYSFDLNDGKGTITIDKSSVGKDNTIKIPVTIE